MVAVGVVEAKRRDEARRLDGMEEERDEEETRGREESENEEAPESCTYTIRDAARDSIVQEV